MELLLVAIAILVVVNSLGMVVLLKKTMTTPARPVSAIGESVVIDTSGLIDGRVLEIVQAGFVPKTIYISHVVIGELQHLADLADPMKRERARFGLDVVKQLQATPGMKVQVINDENPGLLVDDQLVKLAQDYGAALYTTDFNLNKVATIKGVPVLNVNELAQSLRSQILPGEKAMIKIVQKGQDSSQGVGYLADGTMVVVEKAGGKVNQTLEVTFSRMLQTQAGKMLFAKLPPSSDKPQAKLSKNLEKASKPVSSGAKRRSNNNHRHTPEDTLLETVKRYEE